MAVDKNKAQRMAKKVFTRSRNILLSNIQSVVEVSTVLASWNQMDDRFSELEEAHFEYLMAAQIDIDDNQE